MVIILLQQLLVVVNLKVRGCRLSLFHFVLNFKQVLFEFFDKFADSFFIRSLDVCDPTLVLLLQFKAFLLYS